MAFQQMKFLTLSLWVATVLTIGLIVTVDRPLPLGGRRSRRGHSGLSGELALDCASGSRVAADSIRK